MFNKDLLLIDIESTGLDPNKHEIIQLAGILLDKKTLKEKKSFVSFIRPKNWKTRDKESMAVNKISFEKLHHAPSVSQALKKFNRAFPKNVVLSYYVGIMDIIFLQSAYKKSQMKYPFDYHTFNIWSLFYPYMAKKNKLKNKKQFAGFGLEDMLKHFKIQVPNNLHDALVDCQIEAEVLRKVVSQIE